MRLLNFLVAKAHKEIKASVKNFFRFNFPGEVSVGRKTVNDISKQRGFQMSQVKNSTDRDRLLTTKAAAEMIGFRPQTLIQWRHEGTEYAPPFRRIGGRSVRYSEADLIVWLEGREKTNPQES